MSCEQSLFFNLGVESSRSGGLEDLALKPVHEFDHLELFIELQSRCLDQRLQVGPVV